MKPTKIWDAMKESGVHNKLVDETLYIYPDDYEIGSGTQIPLGNFKDEDGDDEYDAFEFDENFTKEPESSSELIKLLKKFRTTGVMENYSKD